MAPKKAAKKKATKKKKVSLIDKALGLLVGKRKPASKSGFKNAASQMDKADK